MSTTTRPSGRTGAGGRRPPPRRASGAGAALRSLLGVVVVLAVLAGGAWVALHKTSPHIPVVVVERCTATLTDSPSAAYDLAPDQAANAALIAAVAGRRGLPARAATIAIATATQESKLRNVTYGDRDSLGLFQQRPSQGWGTVEQVQDPVYATNAFLSSLVKIDDYGSQPIGDVAQRVQRSAFPTAYARHEPSARAWASALAGYSPAALTCRLRPVTGAGAQTPGAGGYWPRTQAVLDAATTERGPVAATPVDAGGAVRLGTAASGRASQEASRTGWALGAWSVAHADALDVVAVGTNGSIWRRDAPEAGWTELPGSQKAAWAPEGAAVVVVAGGELPPS